WVNGPARARRHDIRVPVEMHHRAARRRPSRADDVHAWITRGVLGPALGGEVLDLESIAPQTVADEPRARLVRLARRVDRRNPHQLAGEGDELVDRAVDLADYAVDDVAAHRSPKKYRTPNCTSRPGR